MGRQLGMPQADGSPATVTHQRFRRSSRLTTSMKPTTVIAQPTTCTSWPTDGFSTRRRTADVEKIAAGQEPEQDATTPDAE
jgi:hypothetical protein